MKETSRVYRGHRTHASVTIASKPNVLATDGGLSPTAMPAATDARNDATIAELDLQLAGFTTEVSFTLKVCLLFLSSSVVSHRRWHVAPLPMMLNGCPNRHTEGHFGVAPAGADRGSRLIKRGAFRITAVREGSRAILITLPHSLCPPGAEISTAIWLGPPRGPRVQCKSHHYCGYARPRKSLPCKALQLT